jgi:hypothetical protein
MGSFRVIESPKRITLIQKFRTGELDDHGNDIIEYSITSTKRQTENSCSSTIIVSMDELINIYHAVLDEEFSEGQERYDRDEEIRKEMIEKQKKQ